MKTIGKYIAVIFLILLVLSAIVAGLQTSFSKKIEDISLSTLVRKINDGEVKEITVLGDELEITLADGKTKERSKKETGASLSETLKNLGVNEAQRDKVNIVVKNESGFLYYVGGLLPVLLPFLLVVLI